MPTVLVVSSHVATGDVGGTAQVTLLARAGFETVFTPTVLFGRHPGHGPPGGAPVGALVLAGMLEGVDAQGVFTTLDAVILGYFASAEQAAIAARTVDRIRAVNPRARIIVDPVMGDFGTGLYVKPAVAHAIAADLVPRADLVAPNAWELARLTDRTIDNPASALAAARLLGSPVLASSVTVGPEIGVLYVDEGGAWLAAHRRMDDVPNGTGDLLTALFTAALVQGKSGADAVESAVGYLARRFADSTVRIERMA